MDDEKIPSGEKTHVPQADGAPAAESASAIVEETAQFSVSVDWTGDGSGCGSARLAGETLEIPIGGAREIGGCGKGANPEELLLSAIGACFAATWGIFLAKLKVPYPDPALRLTGALGKDPAGGFRMTRATIFARVPAALYASHRAEVDRTIALAEKYCIISKAVKSAMTLEVVVEERGQGGGGQDRSGR